LDVAINRHLAFTDLLLSKLRLELESSDLNSPESALMAGFMEIGDLVSSALRERMEHTLAVWRELRTGGAV
jgi:hypothetical protein